MHQYYSSKPDTPDFTAKLTIPIDFSSYESMVSSFISICIKNVRNQEIFQKKLDFQSKKIPTLEELGQTFGITRERVRQIVKKELYKFKHRVNINKLTHFWGEIDSAVSRSGGIIYLGELPEILQNKFNWPTAPNYLALGQLISLRRPSSNSYKNEKDLITTECECPSCERVSKQLDNFDFSDNKSYHVEVLSKKIKDSCIVHCPWQISVKIFHKAFIEHLVNQTGGSLRLQEDIVMSNNYWIETYCKKLEDVACYVLECHGEPLHFTEIADLIRNKNHNFKDLSDHNLHSSIIRYDTFKIVGRGTYGLTSWDTKSYRSVSTAIEEFIDKKGLPQRRHQIIQHLDGEFTETNITAALNYETRFKSIHTQTHYRGHDPGFLQFKPGYGNDDYLRFICQ